MPIRRYVVGYVPRWDKFSIQCEELLSPDRARQMSDELWRDGFYGDSRYYADKAWYAKAFWETVWTSMNENLADLPAKVRVRVNRQALDRGRVQEFYNIEYES